MSPLFKDFLAVTALLVAGFLIGQILLGCATVQPNLSHQNPASSWSQDNLKRSDHGCPTAIFIAPDGNLSQCMLSVAVSPAPKDELKYFETADAAVLYVVTNIYEHSHYYEYGGVVLKAPKGYLISQPNTQHHGMDVSLNEDPESYYFPIVATYHVHPCLKNAFTAVFSPQDLMGARSANRAAYVLDECTGALHYWAPGDGYMTGDEMVKMGVNPLMLAEGIEVSPGKIVGQIVVDGVPLN